jgi:hypothetical protein
MRPISFGRKILPFFYCCAGNSCSGKRTAENRYGLAYGRKYEWLDGDTEFDSITILVAAFFSAGKEIKIEKKAATVADLLWRPDIQYSEESCIISPFMK